MTADRKTFGEDECPDTDEDSMKLWLVYSCDGGEDHTIIRKPSCSEVIRQFYFPEGYVQLGQVSKHCQRHNGPRILILYLE